MHHLARQAQACRTLLIDRYIPPLLDSDLARCFGTSPWGIWQRDGNKSCQITIAGPGVDFKTSPVRHAPPWSLRQLQATLRSQLAATFLPAGHPASVAPTYLPYVWWQALHHACGAANGVLASTFLLYSVGLGAGAVPTAGALNWVLKDGLGQVGTLLFGRAIAHNFDVASRAWYVAASAKLNLAIGLEICSFLAPHHFLLMASAANAVKGLAWMAGGSSRSAFNVAFARDNNIADVTAKATSQTICTSLLGTTAGVALAAAIGQSAGSALACYAALSAVHMWSGYRSAACVPLSTLNPSRTLLLAQLFLEQQQQQREAHPEQQSEKERQDCGQLSSSEAPRASYPRHILPTPAELAPRDGLLHQSGPRWLCVGTTLSTLAASHPTPQALAALLPLYRRQRHILVPGRDGRLHLVLHEEAATADAALAVLQALLWRQSAAPHANGVKGEGGSAVQGAGEINASGRVLEGQAQAALQRAQQLVDPFLDELQRAGWDTARVVLESTRRRASW